jgi:hypothetical protein
MFEASVRLSKRTSTQSQKAERAQMLIRPFRWAVPTAFVIVQSASAASFLLS